MGAACLKWPEMFNVAIADFNKVSKILSTGVFALPLLSLLAIHSATPNFKPGLETLPAY